MTSVRAAGLHLVRPGPPAPAVRRERGPARDLRCGSCGYGIATGTAPELCPMCRTAAWEPVPWQPFSRLDGGIPVRT